MLAILLLIFQRTIRNYVSDTIGEIMVNSVQEATGGEYKITYDLVRFDIISSELRISNLSIELDTTVISRLDYLKKKPNLIDVKTPIVVLKLRSIFPLLFKDQLLVSYVGAKNPEFDLVKSARSSSMKNVAEQNRKDVLGIVNSYFAALEIDSFRIISGSFSIQSDNKVNPEVPNIHVGEFTTTLKNFRLDSLSPSILLRGISATSAELEVLNQDIFLPETHQNIHFDRLWLSSSESTITLDSLVINQMTVDSLHSEADVHIPKLSIKGLDFEKAFNNNSLVIRKLQINYPKLNYNQSNTDSEVSNDGSGANDSPIYKYLKEVRIDTIDFSHGDLTLNTKRKSKAKDINFQLLNYTVSPEDWQDHKQLTTINIKSFSASDWEQELPDSIHKASVSNVIYNAESHFGNFNNVKIRPISGRSTYRVLKSRNMNASVYGTVKSITLTNFHPEQILFNKPLELDSVIIDRPKNNVIQYPLMRLKRNEEANNSFQFSIRSLVAKNGSLNLMSYKNRESQTTRLNGFNIHIDNISDETLSDGIQQNARFDVHQGSIELKKMGHTARFSNLSFIGTKNALVQSLDIQPDSTDLPYHHINAHLKSVWLQGINLNKLKNQEIIADTISIGSIDLRGDLTREKFKSGNGFETISVDAFEVGKSNVAIALKNSNFDVRDLVISASDMVLDSQTSKKTITDFNDLKLNFGQFRFNNRLDTTLISGISGYYSEHDSTLFARDIHFQTPNNRVDFKLKEAELKAFSKTQFLDQKIFQFGNGILLSPSLKIISRSNQNNQEDSLSLSKLIFSKKLRGFKFDTLTIFKGKASVILPQNRVLDISSIDGKAMNYNLDSAATIRKAINKFDGSFQLSGINLTGEEDTLAISRLYVDTESENVWSDSILYSRTTKKQLVRFNSPGFAIHEINIPSVLKRKISIRQISTRNSTIDILQTDTLSERNTQFKFPEIKIPFEINVNEITIKNTKFNYRHSAKPYLPFSNIRFDIEVDSLSYEKNSIFNLIENTKDSRLFTYDFSYKLPDSLNTFGFDTLLISSKNQEVRITNLSYIPRYSRQEYGKVAGFQADWKNLLINTINMHNVDFEKAFEDKTFECKKLTINNSKLDLYKDKQLKFPSDRVLPMLQERIRNAGFKLKLDSIEVKNLDINQTTRQSSGLTEGSISFLNTNGVITNITNDSARLSTDRMMKVSANTEIMGSGDLKANFTFDMLDPDNVFFFDARLGAMQASEFNDILEATAFVRVKSGSIRSINLQASANSSYAYGNMSFLYNNLKVETINKKNLKTKGMGKVLKTFFANTFVVKKNNSKYRLFGRRGSMYYERDPARISIDYAAKTALSGVVSSIGARNNRKEIKRIQKEDKQKRDIELKLKKEQQKAAKKAAK